MSSGLQNMRLVRSSAAPPNHFWFHTAATGLGLGENRLPEPRSQKPGCRAAVARIL